MAKTKDVNITIFKGLFPGVGKTAAACKIAKTINTLFISPQNKLCQEIKKDGFECITFHKLFGLSIYQKVEKYRKLYKIDDYKCIVFDEIYMHDIEKLQMIHIFIIENEDKYKILATGDIKQLESFQNMDLIMFMI